MNYQDVGNEGWQEAQRCRGVCRTIVYLYEFMHKWQDRINVWNNNMQQNFN